MTNVTTLMTGAAIFALIGVLSTSSQAATTCTFTVLGSTWSLDADCVTDATIVVPDGVMLDGNGNTLTAEDPPGDHFRGAVVANGGATAHVTHLNITTSGLANVCDAGTDRLRGILFDGASGSITHNHVENINQGASGCQEGNAIEARNAPFDGTHPDTKTVEIAHNVVEDWQKGGIICNGDVECDIHHNNVGESATQHDLAANSVQLGFGAAGTVEHNRIDGNQWLGPTDFVATAVLIYQADLPVVRRNNIGGNADVGIYILESPESTVNNNRVFERGQDGNVNGYDFGMIEYASPGSSITNNKVRGYDVPTDSDSGNITGTKVIPSPHDPGAACLLPNSSAQAC